MIKNLQIEHDACLLCLNCTQIAPEIFEFDEKKQEITLKKTSGFTAEEEKLIKEAADGCAGNAIIFDEE